MAESKDIGPLDWRISIVDKSGRPSPEFQRRWNANRANSALIGTITFGSGPPTSPTPADGAEYVDTSVAPNVLYVGHSGAWVQVSPKTFLQLADAPHAYTGQTLKLVRVNAAETGLEFVSQLAPANPTAVGSDVAVNGVVTTYMRSDAVPAIQKATSSQFGLVKPDGSTITITGGVISSAGGGGGSVGSHVYWRLLMPPNSGYFAYSIAEFTMAATLGGSNQCSGGTPFTNDAGGGAASNAFDGNPATYWASSSYGGQNSPNYYWLGYQFASAVGVKQITVAARNDSAASAQQVPIELILQYSDNGMDYSTAQSFAYSRFYNQGEVRTLNV